jgi:nucleotide-binding universal stress UspA family protein
MTTIAVPVDGTDFSETALASAATMATAMDGAVELLTVSSPGIDPLVDEYYLDVLAHRFRGPTRIRAIQASGRVEEAILGALADNGDADTIICMASHGRVRARLVVGSVSESLVRISPYPTVLVGPHAGPLVAPVGRVIVTLDGSSTAEVVLPVATELTRRLGARLTLLHVLEAHQSVHVVHGYLADLQRQVRGVATHVAVHTANGAGPAKVIAEHAGETGAGLIAMATHGRTGVDRAVLGSVVQSVVHRAPCPVVVLNAGR